MKHLFDEAYRKYVAQEREKNAERFALTDEMREELWRRIRAAETNENAPGTPTQYKPVSHLLKGGARRHGRKL
jgi:replicative DNA helicase